jgi:hypothetical protein
MMLRRMIVVVALSLGLLFSGIVLAADNPGKGNPQTICPVEGGKSTRASIRTIRANASTFVAAAASMISRKAPIST